MFFLLPLIIAVIALMFIGAVSAIVALVGYWLGDIFNGIFDIGEF